MKAAKNKFVFPLLVLAAWTGFGLFFGTQNYLRDTYFGKPARLTGDIIGWLLCGYSWAILTWPVLWFSRRFSLARLGWLRFFALHIPVGVVLSMAQLGIYDTIVHLLFGGQFGFGEYYKFLLANELQSSFLVYFAVVAAITAYDHFFARSRDNDLGKGSVDANISTVMEAAVVPSLNTNGNGNGHAAARRISVKENGRILLLDVADIDWITSEGNYVQLHTPKKKYLIRETMNSMEAKLDAQEFVRLRRSTIVRIGEIKEFHPTFNGEFEVLLKSGITLASSRRYKKNLEHLLKV